MSSRQVAFIFEFGNESCTADNGTISVHGALPAEASPAACKPKWLEHPAFRVLTARRASARSQIEAERRRYAASENELSGFRPPTGTGRVGGHASGVGGGV